MRKIDQNHGWEQVRNLPPELELDAVLKHIQTFPAKPPMRHWTDFFTLKTKWIMLLSALSIFVLVFNFWSTDERSIISSQHEEEGVLTSEVARLAIETEVDGQSTTAPVSEKQSGINPESRTSGPSIALAKQAAAPTSTSERRSSTLEASELVEEIVSDSLVPRELPAMALTSTATLLTQKDPNSPITSIGPMRQLGTVSRAKSIDSPLGEPIQSGKWYFVYDMDGRPFVRYRWKEKFPGSKANWDLVQPLSTLLNDPDAQRMPEKAKNAVGTIYFQGSTEKEQGKFEFYLNPENADRLNAAGAGPSGMDEEALRMTGWTQGLGKERFAHHPKDVLWFRYFLEDVDNETFDLLAKYGYEGEDLHDFWHLINRGINKVELEKYLPIIKAVATEKIPLKMLAKMIASDRQLRIFSLLHQGGYRNLSSQTLNALLVYRDSDNNLERLAELNYFAEPSSLLRYLNLYIDELSKTVTEEGQRPELEDFVAQFIEKNTFTNEGLVKRFSISSPRNWGTSCAEIGRHDQDLPPFNRAVIKGNIRVVIRKGEANTMTTIAYPGKEQLVTAEVKDGVLYLTGPKKQNRSWNYDIQLTATDLVKVKAKTKTCVWLDGERALSEIEGKLCPTRNFGEWVE